MFEIKVDGDLDFDLGTKLKGYLKVNLILKKMETPIYDTGSEKNEKFYFQLCTVNFL